MQGQRLHLSIYHTDWPAKCTSALPLSFPLSTISLRLCHSFILLLQPPLPQTVPHLSIHPSSVFKHLSLCCRHPSVLFLAHSFCVSFFPPRIFLSSCSRLPSCEYSAEMSRGTQFQTQKPETYGTFSTPKVNYSYLSRDCS